MRLLETILTNDRAESLKGKVDAELCIDQWLYPSSPDLVVFKILADDEHVQKITDQLALQPDERLVIYPVEGTLPKVEREKKKEKEKIKVGRFFSISKEELYSDIEQPVSLSANFILMVVLSAFIAGIGIIKDNLAITIGAMVIAPFLGPNMSMSLGTTLGDWEIIRRSLTTGIVATILVLLISVTWGWSVGDLSNITADPDIAYQDILLAIFCGAAGVVSVLSGQGSTMVGVMVAAALLPPLMRAGLFLGVGEINHAINSFLIFWTNVICVNISSISIFYLAGIRPSRWWEKEKARKKTRNALLTLMIILSILVVLIMLVSRLE
jgi:uncharacterized hydrophobic protein (TIGR00341 family)